MDNIISFPGGKPIEQPEPDKTQQIIDGVFSNFADSIHGREYELFGARTDADSFIAKLNQSAPFKELTADIFTSYEIPLEAANELATYVGCFVLAGYKIHEDEITSREVGN